METTETSTQETTQTTQEVSTENKIFDTQAPDVPKTPSSWMWGEELPGNGEKPEWFKDTKYKSVSEQAKAYTELERRLGGFVGAPKEGYQLNEELGLDSNDPSIKAVLDVLGKSNASNEMANELLSTYIAVQQEQVQAQMANEMKLLGDNADYRINAVRDFSKTMLPETLHDTFNSMVTSAKGIEVIETIMAKMQGNKVAPESTTSKQMDASALREMMFKKNENGQLLSSIDPEYKRKVDKAYADFYGN